MRLRAVVLGLGAAAMLLAAAGHGARAAARQSIPTFTELLAHEVALKPELQGVHPRVYVTRQGLEALRERARTTHRAEWQRVLANLPALAGDPPPPPGPQARRSQNQVAFAIVGASLAYAVERRPEYLRAAREWTLAAIDYEPWGYTYSKPNIDLAAGHLLYAIGWAYDLLYHDWTGDERQRIRTSLERHAGLVAEAFGPAPGRRFNFTQNHGFIPTAGLAVTALALMGESAEAPRWAALARAHHHRANQLLSPDGYYYEGMEYWIFSTPWLVHFYDAWEHATGESLWDLGPARQWSQYLAHTLLPDGQTVVDFGDIWEGPLTRAKRGAEYARAYPDGRLQSNYNVLYRVAARYRDSRAQAVADRYAAFGHSNLEEYWTLLWRDPSLPSAAMDTVPLTHHFADMGVVFSRTSWNADATAIAFKAGPPEGHRAARLAASVPEWALDSGHSHPDNGSFIVWGHGRYLTGDTGYAGLPQARHHNTITVGGLGQGVEEQHDVWRKRVPASLDGVRISEVRDTPARLTIVADVAAAYPAEAALTRFTRTFDFDRSGRIGIDDVVETSAPRTVQWYLHTDARLRADGPRYVTEGAPSLGIELDAPGTVTLGETVLMAPGRPGSITKGTEEPRGYELRLEVSETRRARITARLTLRP